jgi:hypothetical protein
VLPSDPAWIAVTLSMPADRAAVAAEGILREWWARQRT